MPSVNLAASSQPPPRGGDLRGAQASRYVMDIPDFTVSANLKSKQDALSFLGKMHALGYETESVKKKVQTRAELIS